MHADDIMIFCKGTSRNVHNLINFFQLYKDSFGQVISKHKSKIFIGSIPGQRLRVISDLLQYFHSDIPFNYFGVPIFKGKPTRRHLYCVADKIKCKLASWKGSILSIMGENSACQLCHSRYASIQFLCICLAGFVFWKTLTVGLEISFGLGKCWIKGFVLFLGTSFVVLKLMVGWDILIWNPSESGELTLKLAYSFVTAQPAPILCFKKMAPQIYPSASFVVWRLMPPTSYFLWMTICGIEELPLFPCVVFAARIVNPMII